MEEALCGARAPSRTCVVCAIDPAHHHPSSTLAKTLQRSCRGSRGQSASSFSTLTIENPQSQEQAETYKWLPLAAVHTQWLQQDRAYASDSPQQQAQCKHQHLARHWLLLHINQHTCGTTAEQWQTHMFPFAHPPTSRQQPMVAARQQGWAVWDSLIAGGSRGRTACCHHHLQLRVTTTPLNPLPPHWLPCCTTTTKALNSTSGSAPW